MAEPWIEYAAHVEHPISHTSDDGRVLLTFIGLAIGAAICVGTAVGAAACVGALVTWGGRGMKLGDMLDDKFLPPDTDEKLGSGLATVRLGPGLKPAARAFTDSRPDDAKGHQAAHCMAEGSTTVMLGPELRPMSRRRDRTTCGGRVVGGLETLAVGGERSAEGVDIEEIDSRMVARLNLGLRVLSIVGSATRGELRRRLVEEAAKEVGAGPVVDVVKAVEGGIPTGGSLMDTYKQLTRVGKGARGLQQIGSWFIP